MELYEKGFKRGFKQGLILGFLIGTAITFTDNKGIFLDCDVNDVLKDGHFNKLPSQPTEVEVVNTYKQVKSLTIGKHYKIIDRKENEDGSLKSFSIINDNGIKRNYKANNRMFLII